MGTKPNWGRGIGAGLSSLGQDMFRYGVAQDRQKFMEEERRLREEQYADRMATAASDRNAEWDRRTGIMAEQQAARDEEDRIANLFLPDGATMPDGTPMMGAGQSNDDMLMRLRINSMLNPAQPEPKSTVTVMGGDGNPYELSQYQAYQASIPGDPDSGGIGTMMFQPPFGDEYPIRENMFRAEVERWDGYDLTPEGWMKKEGSPDKEKAQKPDTQWHATDIVEGALGKPHTYNVGNRKNPEPETVFSGGDAVNANFLNANPQLYNSTMSAVADSARAGGITSDTAVNALIDVLDRDSLGVGMPDKWTYDDDGRFHQNNFFRDDYLSPREFVEEHLLPKSKGIGADSRVGEAALRNTLKKFGLSLGDYITKQQGGGLIMKPIDGATAEDIENAKQYE